MKTPFTNTPKLSYAGEAQDITTINKAGRMLKAATAASASRDRTAHIIMPPSDYEKNLLINIGVLDDY
jgi:hypothetical protein